MLNLPQTEKVTLLRICIAFMLTLHYPLQLDPSRRCIMSLIHAAKQQYYGKKDGGASQKVHHRDSDNDLITAAADGTKMTKEQSTMTVSQDDDDDDGIKDEIEDEKNSNQHSTTKQEHSGNFAPDERQNDLLFYCITVAFLLLSFAVAMVVDDLGVILAMVGATGSTLVSYILPGLIYVKIHPRMDLSKLGAYIQLCMGCLIMPLALYFVLMGKVKH